MELYFIGADHEVTGSCHILHADGQWVMIDRGMEQGKNIYENEDLPVPPSSIGAVVLTHAHIDHSGLLPQLIAQGFKGDVFATPATCDLCGIMLRDSAHIQEFEAEWRNRKAQRQGREAFVPLYTMADAEAAMKHFRAVGYGEIREILPGIRIRFTDVGHLLGSAAAEVWAEEGGEVRKLVFSGDLGNTNQPLLRDPQTVAEADYLIIESTYGDRSHEAAIDYVENLVPILRRTFERGGNVVIPSFAVGRTQEMLYFMRHIQEEHLLPEFPAFKVVVDSPLANEATTVFSRHTADCYDEEALALLQKGINPIGFEGLALSISTEDSISINTDPTPKVIISASGMCDAGRIKHHLKHNLWRPESTILFVGYQAEGTLGRMLIDGVKEVKLFGEPIAVAAEILELPGISGHADREGLLRWADALGAPPKKTFIVHGEDSVCDTFTQLITEKLGYDAAAPYSGAVYDLLADAFIKEPAGIPYVKKSGISQETGAKALPKKKDAKNASVYDRLLLEGNKLNQILLSMQGRSEKEIGEMLDEIAAWNREHARTDRKKR